MNRSMNLLRCERVDLMQIHNLVDWRTHLETLRAWRETGRIRYLGITHYSSSAYAEMEKIMRGETLDFVQLNYSLDDREAERRLLPLAAERGIAVLLNLPFGAGRLLRSVRGEPLPAWLRDLAGSFVEIHACKQSGDLRHPGNGKPESHGGKLPGGRRGDTGRFRRQKTDGLLEFALRRAAVCSKLQFSAACSSCHRGSRCGRRRSAPVDSRRHLLECTPTETGSPSPGQSVPPPRPRSSAAALPG
jgi:hypothetical protein